MITLEPQGFGKIEKATSDRAVRMQAFFAKRGGVIMTNALRNMSYSWRTEQRNEMQRIFDRPSKFTLSAPRVEFNQRLLAGGPLGDQQFTAGSRSSLRYENQAIWKLDDSRGRGQKDLPAGYLRPHILGTRSYDGGTQRALDQQPDFDGRRIIPLSPNPSYVRPQSYKGRPLGGVYSAALQSLAQIAPGAIGKVGVKNLRRPFFMSVSTDPGALPSGIYRRKGSFNKPGRTIGLFFHLAKSQSRHARIWDWSAITRRHIDEAWPRLFRAQFARQLHAAAKATGRTLPPAPANALPSGR